MNESILALIKKVTESEELQAKFAALDSPEEAYELAKTIQEGFTKEEFVEVMTALSSAADGDITDEDLAVAAGGTSSVDDWVDGVQEIGDFATKVSNSIADSIADSAGAVSQAVSQSVDNWVSGVKEISAFASKVSNSAADSITDAATAVSKSIIKSATAVSNSKVTGEVTKFSAAVSKSVSKVTKTLAV